MLRIQNINAQQSIEQSDLSDLGRVLVRLTKEKAERVESLGALIAACESDTASQRFQAEIDGIISHWNSQIARLGGIPRGVWFADFDSGSGYYCWRYPEERIQFWHAYDEGYTFRRPIDHSI